MAKQVQTVKVEENRRGNSKQAGGESDHNAVWMEVKIEREGERVTKKEGVWKWNVKNGLEEKKWNEWEEELAKKEGEWLEMSNKICRERQGEERVVELGKRLASIWNEVAVRVIGKKKIRTSKGKKVNRWWTQEVEESWIRRKQAYRKYVEAMGRVHLNREECEERWKILIESGRDKKTV